MAHGSFEEVAGLPANDLAVWDGEDWAPFLPALDGGLDAIGVHRDRLVAAGGLAKDANKDAGPGTILQLDGDRWLTMGAGLTRGYSGLRATLVTALATWRGSLFVGGDFETAGGKPSPFIARWDGASLASPPLDRLRAAPNPAVEQSTIAFRLDGPGHTAVRVFEIQGRRVATLHDGFMSGGDHTATWNLRDGSGRRVPAGMYFLRVDSPFSWATEKVVVLR